MEVSRGGRACRSQQSWKVDETRFHELSVDEKALTGMAIREPEADVLALQEVESVDTLKHFRAGALGGRKAYPYVAGIDGNDPRRRSPRRRARDGDAAMLATAERNRS